MKNLKLLGLILVLLCGVQKKVSAHCNYTDCGRIVNGKFYSRNYPNGVTAVVGNEGWVQQVPSNGAVTACYSRNSGSNSSTNTMFIGNQEYWKYDHKYVCNVFMDGYIPFLFIAISALGFVLIKKRLVYTY